MAGRNDLDEKDKNLDGSPFQKALPLFLPRIAAKTFGFDKKDVKETYDSLASRMALTSLIASVVTVLMGVIFLIFVVANVWAPEKINLYTRIAPFVMIGCGTVAVVMLLHYMLSGKDSKAVLIIGDLFFRIGIAAALILFFLADIINGDLSQTDSITAAMGILIILVICQPGYIWEMVIYNLAVFLSVLAVTIYGVVVHNMYCLDQYILFLLGFLVASYFVYCSYWYGEALRHYNIGRNAELLFRSTHDPLTSARNRQGLRFYLDERLPRWQAKNESLLVIMLDIDDFKLYNDTFGHLEGDEVLIEIVKAIENCPDLHHVRLFRYGGEEFLLLRSKVDAKEAEELIDAVRKAVENLHFAAPLEAKGPYLTISLGGSLWNVGPDYRFHEQVNDADKALYEAKKQGKNRFVLRTNLTEPPKEEIEQPTLLEEEKTPKSN